MPLLEFTRQCSQELLGTYGILPSGPGRPISFTSKAASQIRYDNYNHWLIRSDQEHARCKYCSGRSTYKCEKCNVPLHPQCHKNYHVYSG